MPKQMFSEQSVLDYFRDVERNIMDKIAATTDRQLLAQSIVDPATWLLADAVCAAVPTVQSGDVPGSVYPADSRTNSPGSISVLYFLPFKGSAEYFNLKPTRAEGNPPVGEVRDGKIVTTFSLSNRDRDAMRHEIASFVKKVRWNLAALASEVAVEKNELCRSVEKAIEIRRAKIKADADFVATLGYRIEKHSSEEQPPRTDAAQPPAV